MNIKLTPALILIVYFSIIFYSSIVCADIVVIVNANNSIDHLERKQVIDLFMGRTTIFPNKNPARTLDIDDTKHFRADFYKALTGKNEAQVDAYWATLIFAGRMSPPEKIRDQAAVIAAVASNEAAIGYVTRQTLPDGVKIVMELQSASQ
jgi:ABC-type phosphate transport system substrate-binding protein